MSYETILFETQGAVAKITLNRPEAMNALSDIMAREMRDAVAKVEQDDALRVLVITGSGRAFCCGADLKGVLASIIGGDRGALLEFLSGIQDLFASLRAMTKPTIAALNGMTIAGGLETAIACDIVLAARSAKIGDGHSNFAVLPGGGGGTLMPRIIGDKKANLLLYTGDSWSAEEFERMGFVSAVHEDDALLDEAMALAARLAEKSPVVLSRMKRMVAEGQLVPAEQAIAFETDLIAELSQTEDFVEGLTAFSEKREPVYKGR